MQTRPSREPFDFRADRSRTRRHGQHSAVAAGTAAVSDAMKSITSRFVMLIATAAVAPLVTYGVVSIRQLRNGTEESVAKGNLGYRDAGGRARSISTSRTTSASSSRSPWSLRTTGLEPWQQARILKDTVLDFPEFRELSIFDAAGKPLGTSRFGPPTVAIPDASDGRRSRRLRRAAQAGQRRAADDHDRRPDGARQHGDAAGSSASSRSKSCGGWSIGSSVGETATQRCSPRRPSHRARQRRQEAACRISTGRQSDRKGCGKHCGGKSADPKIYNDDETGEEELAVAAADPRASTGR